MIAIWPVGPPNEMNPSLTQKRNASPKLGFDTAALSFMECGESRSSHSFYITQYLLRHQIRKQTELLPANDANVRELGNFFSEACLFWIRDHSRLFAGDPSSPKVWSLGGSNP